MKNSKECRFSKYATHLILLSVFLAIILGIWIPAFFKQIGFLGVIFINLLKLFALPLICSAFLKKGEKNVSRSILQNKVMEIKQGAGDQVSGLFHCEHNFNY